MWTSVRKSTKPCDSTRRQTAEHGFAQPKQDGFDFSPSFHAIKATFQRLDIFPFAFQASATLLFQGAEALPLVPLLGRGSGGSQVHWLNGPVSHLHVFVCVCVCGMCCCMSLGTRGLQRYDVVFTYEHWLHAATSEIMREQGHVLGSASTCRLRGPLSSCTVVQTGSNMEQSPAPAHFTVKPAGHCAMLHRSFPDLFHRSGKSWGPTITGYLPINCVKQLESLECKFPPKESESRTHFFSCV